jgi:hypothetical protein
MTAPAIKTETVILSLEDLKKLKSRHRPRFSDDQVKRALKYQLEKDCTLEEAAATEGMTNQTLAKRRDELYEKMGLTDETAKVAPKQAVKPAASPKKK